MQLADIVSAVYVSGDEHGRDQIAAKFFVIVEGGGEAGVLEEVRRGIGEMRDIVELRGYPSKA